MDELDQIIKQFDLGKYVSPTIIKGFFAFVAPGMKNLKEITLPSLKLNYQSFYTARKQLFKFIQENMGNVYKEISSLDAAAVYDIIELIFNLNKGNCQNLLFLLENSSLLKSANVFGQAKEMMSSLLAVLALVFSKDRYIPDNSKSSIWDSGINFGLKHLSKLFSIDFALLQQIFSAEKLIPNFSQLQKCLQALQEQTYAFKIQTIEFEFLNDLFQQFSNRQAPAADGSAQQGFQLSDQLDLKKLEQICAGLTEYILDEKLMQPSYAILVFLSSLQQLQLLTQKL